MPGSKCNVCAAQPGRKITTKTADRRKPFREIAEVAIEAVVLDRQNCERPALGCAQR